MSPIFNHHALRGLPSSALHHLRAVLVLALASTTISAQSACSFMLPCEPWMLCCAAAHHSRHLPPRLRHPDGAIRARRMAGAIFGITTTSRSRRYSHRR